MNGSQVRRTQVPTSRAKEGTAGRAIRGVAIYLAACGTGTAIGWAVYVAEPLSEAAVFARVQFVLIGALLAALFGLDVSLLVVAVGWLLELVPLLLYLLRGKRRWLLLQVGVLVVHFIVGFVLYWGYVAWQD